MNCIIFRLFRDSAVAFWSHRYSPKRNWARETPETILNCSFYIVGSSLLAPRSGHIIETVHPARWREFHSNVRWNFFPLVLWRKRPGIDRRRWMRDRWPCLRWSCCWGYSYCFATTTSWTISSATAGSNTWTASLPDFVIWSHRIAFWRRGWSSSTGSAILCSLLACPSPFLNFCRLSRVATPVFLSRLYFYFSRNFCYSC